MSDETARDKAASGETVSCCAHATGAPAAHTPQRNWQRLGKHAAGSMKELRGEMFAVRERLARLETPVGRMETKIA